MIDLIKKGSSDDETCSQPTGTQKSHSRRGDVHSCTKLAMAFAARQAGATVSRLRRLPTQIRLLSSSSSSSSSSGGDVGVGVGGSNAHLWQCGDAAYFEETNRCLRVLADAPKEREDVHAAIRNDVKTVTDRIQQALVLARDTHTSFDSTDFATADAFRCLFYTDWHTATAENPHVPAGLKARTLYTHAYMPAGKDSGTPPPADLEALVVLCSDEDMFQEFMSAPGTAHPRGLEPLPCKLVSSVQIMSRASAGDFVNVDMFRPADTQMVITQAIESEHAAKQEIETGLLFGGSITAFSLNPTLFGATASGKDSGPLCVLSKTTGALACIEEVYTDHRRSQLVRDIKTAQGMGADVEPGNDSTEDDTASVRASILEFCVHMLNTQTLFLMTTASGTPLGEAGEAARAGDWLVAGGNMVAFTSPSRAFKALSLASPELRAEWGKCEVVPLTDAGLVLRTVAVTQPVTVVFDVATDERVQQLTGLDKTGGCEVCQPTLETLSMQGKSSTP